MENKLFVLSCFLKFQNYLLNGWMVTDPSDTKTNGEMMSEKFKVNGKECVQNYKVGEMNTFSIGFPYFSTFASFCPPSLQG